MINYISVLIVYTTLYVCVHQHAHVPERTLALDFGIGLKDSGSRAFLNSIFAPIHIGFRHRFSTTGFTDDSKT